MTTMPFSMQLPLHDIVDQHQVSWWPLAVGWWLLLAAILIVGTGLWLWLRRMRRQRQLNRQVEQLLNAPAQSISELNLRLKQVLMLKHARSEVANSSEESWLEQIILELPTNQRIEFHSQFSTYAELRYRPHSESAVTSYQTLILNWWSCARPRFIKEMKDV